MKTWRTFLGAAVLIAGLLLPFAPAPAVVAGIAVAAFVTWLRTRIWPDPR